MKNNVDLNKAHYTNCKIEFLDDNTIVSVIIKSNDEFVESEDDNIFFYGLHYNTLLQNYKNDEVVENEWKVVSIESVWN